MSKEFLLIGIFVMVLLAAVIITYFVAKRKAEKDAGYYQSLRKTIKDSNNELERMQKQLAETKSQYATVDAETKELQALKGRSDELSASIEENSEKLRHWLADIEKQEIAFHSNKEKLHSIMSKIDLYSRLDEFTDQGHFNMPEYLYGTSDRFAEEIKRVRTEQRELIRAKQAIIYPEDMVVTLDGKANKSLTNSQVRFMLSAFNINCDILIAKVNPSNYDRTIERMRKFANSIERSAMFQAKFNTYYLTLKDEECNLQYQFTLKKKDEQDEQRLIREQIREEQRAVKEYERAVAKAKKEENLYQNLLAQARKELETATQEERLVAEKKISDLEIKLQEAEERERRAKSMAEQTRKGHVYIISNIGSFGEGVYKIGLTRRLDPMERVKELGDSSVPFTFDVHAIIYVEDAPELESKLHREFSNYRVNAVNLRKEFFRVDLYEIKSAVKRIAGIDKDFHMTALAEEYYESLRLRGDKKKHFSDDLGE